MQGFLLYERQMLGSGQLNTNLVKINVVKDNLGASFPLAPRNILRLESFDGTVFFWI